MKDKYVAYCACNNDFETFETFEKAVAWLTEGNDEGISEETIDGDDYIAKITHQSKYTKTDERKDYHEHTDDCPVDCDEEEWPYDCAWDHVGNVTFEPIEGESHE